MQPLAFLQNLSSWEIILIFLVVLLFFGAKRLPDLFRSFGKSLREFKKATSEIEDDIRTAMEEEPEENKHAQHPAQKEATTDPKQVEASSETDESDTEPETEEEKKDNETSKA
ncbi:twin-arginine translocase TatA/TatE family subunit [Coraliomargarita sinensis]|uniref:Sec-independent protein translocase protein TatA n=1 Tax=Coraliomargarita sinensis TaxID=2174842 RepID=A0A317ZG48_9BACT|nr:twin-arginine translocase TatA/TatE family subunit [Coraliomargarita sinensis]PXA04585.1 twin-arginine translocase TatA/TatE family subunit [Coraliomargarita sinensis]